MKFGFPDQGGKSSFAIPLCTMVSIRSFSPTTPHIARFLAARHAVRTSIAPVTEDHRRLGERGVTHLKGSHVSQKVFCAAAQNSLLNRGHKQSVRDDHGNRGAENVSAQATTSDTVIMRHRRSCSGSGEA